MSKYSDKLKYEVHYKTGVQKIYSCDTLGAAVEKVKEALKYKTVGKVTVTIIKKPKEERKND